MSLFTLAFICVAALAGASADSSMPFGMSMAVRAYGAVCWYETLKIFPHTHKDEYIKCGGSAPFIEKQIKPTERVTRFGEIFLKQKTMDKFSNNKPYKPCEKYLKDADGVNAAAPVDESHAMNDEGNQEYPYRAFSHCMMKALRDTHGDKAIDAVYDERTHGKKHWQMTLLDRENEFRKRHGSNPLKLNDELNAAAQKWAETNAENCKMEHSKPDDAGRPFRGNYTGESLSVSSGDDDKAIAAYLAADGWYEEVQNYPYPGGYNGKNAPKPIGHFTQSVWKGSEHVGYGYAYNPKCDKYTRYVAARYYPGGNIGGQYQANVGKVQD